MVIWQPPVRPDGAFGVPFWYYPIIFSGGQAVMAVERLPAAQVLPERLKSHGESPAW